MLDHNIITEKFIILMELQLQGSLQPYILQWEQQDIVRNYFHNIYLVNS
jgi:hypothetical protein